MMRRILVSILVMRVAVQNGMGVWSWQMVCCPAGGRRIKSW